ncbi:conjugative transposon protein TraM [Chitinophaga polysaccharea]|uniref:conjugative transposon protein TraM n=1 Tax=Chitinophaga polysaccharea TaxID=1293035 RepID=UPI001159CC93|nr:conjugative transposon protein TraM [Chitinophaga polysaccharea]
MEQMTEKQLRFRKLLLVLPLITLPFISLAFWALGGGKATPAVEQKQVGLNTALPEAQLKTSNTDKLSLYKQNGVDTAILESVNKDSISANSAITGAPFGWNGDWNTSGSGNLMSSQNMQEQRLQQRLDDLERLMRQPNEANYSRSDYYPQEPGSASSSNQQLQRIEQLVNNATNNDDQPDAELDQLNGMLERVLDIQHPERYREKLKDYSLAKRGRILPVGKKRESYTVPISGQALGNYFHENNGVFNSQQSAFYSLDDKPEKDSMEIRSISAIVAETQTIVSGASLKLQLNEDIYVAGTIIPKGTPVYGACTLEGERLMVNISGIRLGNRHFPVGLTVYGLDAMAGIRIPGAITRDAAKEGADRAVQSMQLLSLDPSIGAQAAGAGIEAAKGLFNRKMKLIRATVNAGLQILLVGGDANE